MNPNHGKRGRSKSNRYKRKRTRANKDMVLPHQVSQEAAMHAVLTECKRREQDIVKKGTCTRSGDPRQNGAYWYFDFQPDPEPVARHEHGMKLGPESVPGLRLMAGELFRQAAGDVVAYRHDPENTAFQEAVTFLLDAESPWHRLMEVDRKNMETVLERIMRGEEIAMRPMRKSE